MGYCFARLGHFNRLASDISCCCGILEESTQGKGSLET